MVQHERFGTNGSQQSSSAHVLHKRRGASGSCERLPDVGRSYLSTSVRFPEELVMTLHELLVDEIKDLYHAEKQLTKALPKMVKAATHEDLREAFETHLEETREQITRLEAVFAALDEAVKAKPCAGIAGIIEEGAELMQRDADASVMDAGLIAAGQRAEHYEIAAYGTCITWARLMGHDEVASLLEQTLDEEKAADKKLSALAEQEINQAALNEGRGDDEADDDSPVEAREQASDRGAPRRSGRASQRHFSSGRKARTKGGKGRNR
jgi:ferritin-like metal-binding protein YciE